MNKVEKLIQKLCPEGVKSKELQDVCTFRRGTIITLKDSRPGIIPVIAGGQKPSYYHDTPNRTGETIAISSSGAYAGFVSYWSQPVFLSDSFSVEPNSEFLIPKFVFFYLKNNQENIYSRKKGGGVPHVQSSGIVKFLIPVPPLPIQQEIVRILDQFTTLEARKKQYEYYRNELLSFEGKDVEWKTLGEIGEFIRGKRFVKTDFRSEGFPCIHYGEMYTHYKISATESKSFIDAELVKKLRVANKNDVIIVAAGETIEDIGMGVAWLSESEVVIHDACFIFKHKMEPKFVAHFTHTKIFHEQIKKHISSGKISSINSSGLGKALIPVPSLSEQRRIVAILDRFDALVNDISVGLPAEITARRRQYEHYRERLLTFERKE